MLKILKYKEISKNRVSKKFEWILFKEFLILFWSDLYSIHPCSLEL